MLRNLLSSVPAARNLTCAPARLKFGQYCGHIQRVPLRATLCTPIFLPFAPRITRYSSTTPTVSNHLGKHKANLPLRIVEKVKEEVHRFVSGCKELGRNTKTAASLLRSVCNGHILTRRERILMVRTVSDLVRMVPFIIIVVVPFAEFALPILLKVFPNMLPSTFVSASYKEQSQARNLQAKLEVIEVLQAASEDMVLREKLDSKDARESLISFMTKVSRGEEINPPEVLKISKVFHNEFSLASLERPQLLSLVKFFGLPSIGTSFILQEELKFKWNLVKKDDAHILRDGIDSLSPAELEEAAIFRGFKANEHHDKKQYLQEWVSLSQENVPPYLLLLSRAHFFVKNTKQVTDITPPIIAPYLPSPDQTVPVPFVATKPASPPTSASQVIDLPEKELIPIDFKNLHHELSHDPVAAKLWVQIARFTRDLKKETFGGRQSEVIYLGDPTGDKLSTTITREMRQYLHAIFVALDKDGDRKLSVTEVEHGLHASDIPLNHDEAVALVKMHDTDGDSCLSFDEFVDLLLYVRKTNGSPML